jgi:hypothetical protein
MAVDALPALFVRLGPNVSPVLNEPAPAKVFEELVGETIKVSPICTTELGPTLNILIFPTMAGIGSLFSYEVINVLYVVIRLDVLLSVHYS